jgi:methylthioribose-1-phosphate isomerase
MQTEQPIAVQSIEWRDDHVRIVDQTFLPRRTVYSDIRDVGRMWEAIKTMRIRGAPAIGIAAAYGFYLGIRDLPESGYDSFKLEVERLADYLTSARPTAVNLKWAIDRISSSIHAYRDKSIPDIKKHVLKIAITIHDEDRRVCRQIGINGQELISKKANILTHCNTGSLATSQYGTALSIIYHAHENGKKIHVWVDETRPLLQGARLTAWELLRVGIPMNLVVDSAAGMLMHTGKVDLVIVGTDRVAANGDVANKIGTYSLAVLAKENSIPFYVAAPLSSIDMKVESGDQIPIEERDTKEITNVGNVDIAPAKVKSFNPSFDITPARYITGFITEKGIIKPDYKKSIAGLFGD